jgi:streptogramin lyase
MGPIVPRLQAQNFTFTTIAGGTQGSNDGAGSDAQFSQPTGVAVDGAGNIYVADQANNAIREITPFGTNWIVATIAGGAQGSLDGANTAAQFYRPTGIAMDSATNLYVADQFNHTIRKITPTGTNWVVSTIAGQVRMPGANDGANLNAQFHNPTGIAVDNAGNLFVADEFNNAIRMITPEGTNWVVSTIAGGAQGAADGTNTAAQFHYPAGVVVDSNNRVFVADQFNNIMRLITPMGTNWVVTTIAGQLNAGASNGLGTNAQFDTPVGVALTN